MKELLSLLDCVERENNALSIGFRSTRSTQVEDKFWTTLTQGLANDGGLLVPTALPIWPKEMLFDEKFWLALTPAGALALILKPFIGTAIENEELISLTAKALSFDMPLQQLDVSTWVLRLDQGPTASFKDNATAILVGLMDEYCRRFDSHLHLLTATSGDTGVSVGYPCSTSKRVSSSILYGAKTVSRVQEQQMQELSKFSNLQVLAIDGNFDQCQDIVKVIQEARYDRVDSIALNIKKRFNLDTTPEQIVRLIHNARNIPVTSANSINIWRLLPQMVQYVMGYAKMIQSSAISAGEKIVYAVPCGNAGHLVAGLYAEELGIPIQRRIAGTNANNVLANIIGSWKIRHRPFTATSSPSMDILEPSNLERLFYHLSMLTGSRDAIDYGAIKSAIKGLGPAEEIDLAEFIKDPRIKQLAQFKTWAEDVETNQETKAMMRYLHHRNGLVMEPHGITAAIATFRARAKGAIGKHAKVVIFETAHPDKFPEALEDAGITVPVRDKHPSLQSLENCPHQKPSTVLPANPLVIAREIARFYHNLRKLNPLVFELPLCLD